jgi:hypothetical protein
LITISCFCAAIPIAKRAEASFVSSVGFGMEFLKAENGAAARAR